jgi:hypothetical protein
MLFAITIQHFPMFPVRCTGTDNDQHFLSHIHITTIFQPRNPIYSRNNIMLHMSKIECWAKYLKTLKPGFFFVFSNPDINVKYGLKLKQPDNVISDKRNL